MNEKVTAFYAYHGTTLSAAKEILASKKFDLGKQRDDHWLGQGSYFFREDWESAKIWASTKIANVPELNDETPCVIETKVDATSNNFLNLDSRSGMKRFERYLSDLKQNGFGIRSEEFLEKTQAKIRCYLMSLLPQDIWIIQRTFRVNSKYDDIQEFRFMGLHLHGTQVCVRNQLAILHDTMDIFYMPVTRPKRGRPRLL